MRPIRVIRVLLVVAARSPAVRSTFAFASRARASFTFAGARLVDRIRTGAARHRRLWLENLPAIDPNLDSDLAKRRWRFRKTVIDISAQRVQRKLSLQVPLTARDLSAIQTTTNFDLDPLRAKPQRLFHRFSHRASERDTLLELRGDLLGLELRVQLRLVNLLDRHQHFAPGL